MPHLPKLRPERIAAVDADLALKASRASNRPPTYGAGWGSTLPGEGFGPGRAGARDYLAEIGRIDLNPLVRLILDWYANAWTQASLRVGRKLKKGQRKGEYEVNATHDLNRIFRRPCPVFSARETGAMFIGGILIDGNAYGVIVEDNGGQPAEVWWVPNWQVEVMAAEPPVDPRRPIRAYRIHDLNGGWREYPPENILHVRDLPDPRNPLIGLGRLKCFLPYLLAVQSSGEYTNEALKKGNTGIVLMPPESTGGSYSYTPAEESEMRGHAERIRRGLARGGNTPVMFLTSYLVHEKIGLSPAEMEASTIVDRPESYVLAAGGLSSMVLNLPSSMSGQTFANKAEASRAAWEDSAVPMFTLIAEAWQDQVLYRRDPETGEEEGRFGDAPGLEVWADTSEVPALTENMQEKADLWTALTDAGYAKREWVAASIFDIPPEAIPEDEPEPEAEEPAEDWDPEPEEGDEPEDDEGEPPASTKAARGGKRPKIDFGRELAKFEEAEALLDSMDLDWDTLESATDAEVAALGLDAREMWLLGLKYEGEDERPARKSLDGSDCGCGDPGDAFKARGGSSALRRTKDGKLVSRRSKTGNPACSAAASLLAQGKHTADSQAVLGRCRAQARHARDAAIRREAGDDAGAARAERRARRGLTDKEVREKLAKAKELRAARAAGRTPSSPASASSDRRPRAASASTPAPRGTPAASPLAASRPAAADRIEAAYRRATARALEGTQDPAVAQARLDLAAARFAKLPSKTQAEVASRIVGVPVRSGADARRLLAHRHNEVVASTERSREILDFGTAREGRSHLLPYLQFPEAAPRAARAPRAPRPASDRPASAPPTREPAPLPPAKRRSADAAVARLGEIQAAASGGRRPPALVDRDLDLALGKLDDATLRAVEREFTGVNLGKTKRGRIDVIRKRIEDVRASHERSREILGFKALDKAGALDPDPDSPDPDPSAPRGPASPEGD